MARKRKSEADVLHVRRIIRPRPSILYPRFYLLPVLGGYSLFAGEGEHRGAGLGFFYNSWGGGLLRLYGAENFAERGGSAWCHHGHESWECPYPAGMQFRDCDGSTLKVVGVRVDWPWVWDVSLRRVEP